MDFLGNLLHIAIIVFALLYILYSICMTFYLLGKIIRCHVDKEYAKKQPVLWKEIYLMDFLLYATFLWLPIKLSNKE